mgnify:CR=1 FL=1
MNNLKNIFLTPRVEELKSSYHQKGKFESIAFLAELLKRYILSGSDSPEAFTIRPLFDSYIVSGVMRDLGFSEDDYEAITYHKSSFTVINFFYHSN